MNLQMSGGLRFLLFHVRIAKNQNRIIEKREEEKQSDAGSVSSAGTV